MEFFNLVCGNGSSDYIWFSFYVVYPNGKQLQDLLFQESVHIS